MAFTLQDDLGAVAGANACISEAEFITYHADRGNDHSAFSTAQVEQAIIKATDYVDSRFLNNFPGTRLVLGQSTEWPREDAYDREGDLVEGIPTALKEALAEYTFVALSSDLTPTPDYDAGGVITRKKEKLGPLEEETVYSETSQKTGLRTYPVADLKLRSLLTGSRSTGRVIR